MDRDYYQYARPDLHPLIPLEAKRILDVGCASGALGKALKDRQACHVTGIELSETAAQTAKEVLDEVLIGEALPLMQAMPEARFDCIVLADVLEHMERPDLCLKEVPRLLKENGRLVASLPNVRHWSVIRNLLEGRWDYEEAGILDRTHLRFFTRESMLPMFAEAGLLIERLDGTVRIGEEVPAGFSESLHSYGLDTSTLDNEGRIYQFLISAIPVLISDQQDGPPMVSVILPTHDRPDFLREALESLQNQHFKNFEVLVINDGELPVEPILAEFPAVSCRSLRTPSPHRGPAATRNLGLEAACGKYIAFLDDDDRFYPDHLELLVRFATIHGAMVVYADSYEVSQKLVDGKWESYQRQTRYSEDFNRDKFLMTNYVPILNFLIRREALEQVGFFDEALYTLEDWDLWIRLSRRFVFLHLAGNTAEYRVRPEGRITTTAQFLPAQRYIFDKYADLSRQLPQVRVWQKSQLHWRENVLSGKVFDLGIAIAVQNELEDLRDCLSSLVEVIPDELQAQLLIVDDGSTDGTLEYLADLEGDILAIHHPTPDGWAKSLNEAIGYLNASSVLILDTSTRLTSEALLTLKNALEADKDLGAVGFSPRRFEGRTEPSLDKGCLMVRQSAFLDVGGFDEKYERGWQDDDLARKLRAYGRSIAHVEDDANLDAAKAENQRLTPADRERFASKWAPGIDETPFSAHPTAEPPLFSLVTLTYNQLEYTRRFVESVFAHSTVPFELIVIDNGSQDDTPSYLSQLAERHHNVHLILNEQNRGFAGGCNQGIAIARGEVIVLINNDTVVTTLWMERLLRALKNDPTVGMVGPRTNRTVGIQLVPNVPYDEEDPESIQAFARQMALRNRREGMYAGRAIGFCVAIRREVLETIGGLDTTYGTGNYEDDDLSMRVLAAGYHIWIVNDCFIHHYGGKTFKGRNIDYEALMLRNWEIFKAKWGLPEDQSIDKGYKPRQILSQSLEAHRLVFPILCPQSPPAFIEGAKCANFLVAPDWQQDGLSLRKLLQSFARAFGPRDDVALILWHDPLEGIALEAAGAWLENLIAAEGLDPESMADLILHSYHPGPLERGGIYRAAQVFLVLEAQKGTLEATACGVPCLENPGLEELHLFAKKAARC